MKPVRRSQLISPWGVGGMIDFPDNESLMVCGLDVWPFAKGDCPPDFKIEEERLQARLRIDHFRLPPDFRQASQGVQYPNLKIPFVRFPRWHYCPRCGNMQQQTLFGGVQTCDAPDYANGLNCMSLNSRRRPRLLPVRFLSACALGHIQDFPFMEWVHGEKYIAPDCRLRLRAGRGSAGLSGINIQCSCGASKSMQGAFNDGALSDIGVYCGGLRPWLGEMNSDITKCGNHLSVLQRGASNVYFPNIMSSIYLPLWGEKTKKRVVDLLEDPEIWKMLSGALVDGKVDQSRCELICQFGKCKGVDPLELARVAQLRVDGLEEVEKAGDQSEEEYRQAEYEAMTAGRGSDQTDLFIVSRDLDVYRAPIDGWFDKVMLVKKLRETRVFCGFSRYLPEDGRRTQERIKDLRLDERIDWLPCAIVRGEGILLKFNEDKLNRWEGRQEVIDQFEPLIENYNRVRRMRGQDEMDYSPKYVMIHTLAHLLINQLCFECGYGTASLRERIYCDAEFKSFPMSGVLIYTASGDSEGTLGGLVRQGEPGKLEKSLNRALRTALWCSADPTCVESNGQGPDSCNLAACHSCALLPETSCEEGNRLLDRSLVVGTPKKPSMGFFSDYILSLT